MSRTEAGTIDPTVLRCLNWRLCVVAGDLREPLDEGFRKTSHAIVCELSRRMLRLLVVSPSGRLAAGGQGLKLPSNRLLLSWSLKGDIASFDPHVVFYIPQSSATFFSFLRARVLRSYAPKARIFMLALQPRYIPLAIRVVLRSLAPTRIFVQSESSIKAMERIKCVATFLPSGVDLDRFAPVTPQERRVLRAKYGLDDARPVVLHVGHISPNRGLQLLRQIQHSLRQVQVVVVGSTTTRQDQGLLRELDDSGIIVLNHYIERIEEIYQISDCYVFPTSSSQGSIEVPLSVLEAMACNLPVVSYPFGGLPKMFEEGNGFWFTRQDEFVEKTQAVLHCTKYNTRAMVEPYSWERVVDILLREIMY